MISASWVLKFGDVMNWHKNMQRCIISKLFQFQSLMELKYVLNAPATSEITPEESQRGEKAPGYSGNIWFILPF